MKTVAFVSHYLGPKLGIGQYLDQLLPPLVEMLTEQGVNVRLVSSPNAARMTPALQDMSHLVDVLPVLDSPPGQRWGWFLTRFSQYCKSREIDLVIWLSNPLVLPWHPTSIAVLHDVNEWKTQEKYGSRLRTILRSLIYLDASLLFSMRIIAVSQATEQDLKHFRPQKSLQSKVKTIVNGMDTSLVHLPAEKISLPESPFLLSVGRIDPEAKSLPEAVALVQALREVSGVPWELHLVGGMNTSTQNEGQAFLSSVKDFDWITYHGHVSDSVLAQWYRNATAIIFLSNQEGFGLPIAEAFSFGRWVIVSQHNLAAVEAGGNATIPINPDLSSQAAAEVLNCLSHNKVPPKLDSYNSWRSVASRYKDEILQTLSSLAH